MVMAKHSYRPTEEETKNVLRMRSGDPLLPMLLGLHARVPSFQMCVKASIGHSYDPKWVVGICSHKSL